MLLYTYNDLINTVDGSVGITDRASSDIQKVIDNKTDISDFLDKCHHTGLYYLFNEEGCLQYQINVYNGINLDLFNVINDNSRSQIFSPNKHNSYIGDFFLSIKDWNNMSESEVAYIPSDCYCGTSLKSDPIKYSAITQGFIRNETFAYLNDIGIWTEFVDKLSQSERIEMLNNISSELFNELDGRSPYETLIDLFNEDRIYEMVVKEDNDYELECRE